MPDRSPVLTRPNPSLELRGITRRAIRQMLTDDDLALIAEALDVWADTVAPWFTVERTSYARRLADLIRLNTEAETPREATR